MKLSAFILSVNIAATIPIAMQCTAQASEEATSDNASIPKNSIKSPDARPKTSKITAARRKFSIAPQAAPAPATNVITVNGVSLRPFVPGRKLPHRADVLMAQQPTMAQDQSAPLSARITENCNAGPLQAAIAPYAQTYYASTPYMTSAPRVMPNELQAVARQVKQSLKRRSAPPQRQPNSPPQEPVQPQMAEGNGDFGQNNGNEGSAEWMANQQNLNVVAPPAVPGQEGNEAQMGQQQPMENVGTAGPPPFPLNLLPQQSLKQFIGSRPAAARKTVAPGAPSFFGSWHGNTNVAAHNVAPTNALPPGGFQSHLHARGFGGAHVATRHAPATTPRQSKTLIAQARKPAPAEKISLYAPYHTAFSGAY